MLIKVFVMPFKKKHILREMPLHLKTHTQEQQSICAPF